MHLTCVIIMVYCCLTTFQVVMAGGKKGKKQHPPYHMEDSDEFEDAEDLGDTSIPVSGTQTQIMVQNNFHMQLGSRRILSVVAHMLLMHEFLTLIPYGELVYL